MAGMSAKPRVEPPLAGFTVVDLSTGIAGAYCTKLLADGGATVIKIEPPEGDPLRRWSASGAAIEPGDDGALFSFLAGSKHSVVAEPDTDTDVVNDLLASADAVVWSRGSTVTESEAFTPAAIRSGHPHLTVTSITPFGLDGPWCDRPATEFTLQAWSGGIVGLGRGSPDRAPVFVGGQVGEYLAGAYASAATLASRRRGVGELVDLSMLEVQILGLTYYPVTYFEMLGRPWRDARKLTVPGIARAKDGLVDVGCGTAQQWFDLCAMIGHQDWIDEDSPLSITEHANEKAAEIYSWFDTQTVDDIRELATAFRIPNAPVANGATITELDQFQHRHSFVANPRDGFTQPAPPYRMHPTELSSPQVAPRLGEHTAQYRQPGSSVTQQPTRADARDRLPFSGLRVLDMTTFWAGPSCTHFFAMLGAEVIHVESTSKPDGARLIAGIPVTEDQWWEKSPIFSALNTNKKGLTLDLQTAAGRDLLRRLIATSDVIVENFTPRVLDQIGLDFAAVQAIRPDAILLRMPGFGLDGPWRDKPAFAYVIEAASGVSWLTGYPDRNPYEPYSIGDPNAGVHAVNALLLALESPAPHRPGRIDRGRDDRRGTQHRRRTGHRVLRLRGPAATRRAIGDRRPRRRTSTARPMSMSSAASTAGSRSLSRRRAVGRTLRRARPAAVGAGSQSVERGRPPRTTRPHRRAAGRVVSGSQQRRHRPMPLGCRCSGGQGDAAAPPDRDSAAAVPRLLRGRRPPGERPGAAQHGAGAVLRRT